METMDLRKKVMLLTALIAITIIIFIVTLFVIWMPKSSKEKQEVEIGEYTSSTSTTYNFVDSYIEELEQLFKEGNVEKLYSLLNDGYVAEKGITKENFKKILEDKKLYKRSIKATEYVAGALNNENHFKVVFKSVENRIDESVIIREISPRDYRISFDNYVYSADNVGREYLSNKIFVTLNSVDFGVATYSVNMTIKNNNDCNIILNKNNKQEFVEALHMSQGTIPSTASFAAGKQIILAPGEQVVVPAVFKINALTHGNILGFIIKNVEIQNTQEVVDINLSIV